MSRQSESLILHYRLQEPKVKEQRLASQSSTEESAMNAMEWLVRQLAWEQRLGQLRTGTKNPSPRAHEVEAERKAA
jgi:hypothetical protein